VSKLPGGTVTLVFTDIEGSTRLLASLGSQYEAALADHRQLLRDAFSSHHGVEVDTQGDALFYAFQRAHDALAGALAAQRALASHSWPDDAELRVRMGIHTGEPTVSTEGYVGRDVHLGARICAAAWGEQILLSDATARLLGQLPEASLRDLGEFSLKDIDDPVRLHQVIAAGLRHDFPPPRTASSHPTNLPLTLSPLVGRAEDIAELVSLLAAPEVRVVTLTGPGGVGKTRLALAVGQGLLASFPDGVFFVDLSALSDPALVVGAIVAALGLRESPGRTLTETLSGYLASRHTLLILDNLEHLLDVAADVAALVSSASSLKVLVTSREPLRIEGEREFPLPPLALPVSGDEPEAILASPAVDLFVGRAQAVRPGFTVPPEAAPDVARICRRVDGLPLAIELAAARVKVLSLPALATRLEQSFAALGAGRRGASARQRTLRGAMAWSYELLSEDEQSLFARLGVFVGGWSLEAAEAVCDRGGLHVDVLDGLASLVDKSLVRAVQEDEERFTMLETIRDFAADKLQESEATEEVRRAHFEYFRKVAEEAEQHLIGRDQREWLFRLVTELPNLRTAFAWGFHNQPRETSRAVGSSARVWYLTGRPSEGRTWLARALVTVPDDEPRTKSTLLWMLAVLAWVQDDLTTARELALSGSEVAEMAGDEDGLARCIETAALCEMDAGLLTDARRHLETNLVRSRAIQDERGVADTSLNLARLALLEENYSEAVSFSTETLQLHRATGDNAAIASSLTMLGFSLLLTGRTHEAKTSLQEGLVLASQLGHDEQVATAMEGLACAMAIAGSTREAVLLLGTVDRIRREDGIAPDTIESSIRQRTEQTLGTSLSPDERRDLSSRSRFSSVGEVVQVLKLE